jgi:CBS domain-containing protein
MRVEELMSHQANTIDADQTLVEAAQRMRDSVVGALPVLSCGRLVGVVTDRDLAVRAVAWGLDVNHIHVRQVMSHGPVTCLPGESVEAAVDLMRHHQIRRLVVVDDSLLPIGLLSVDDIALFPETAPLAIQVLTRVPATRSVELDGLLREPC